MAYILSMGNANTARRLGAALLALALLAGTVAHTNPIGGYRPARTEETA